MGMPMNISTTKESPSKKAINLRKPMDVVKNFVICSYNLVFTKVIGQIHWIVMVKSFEYTLC